MHCEICSNESAHYVLIPKKRPDGCLETIACRGCAEASGLYCVLHGSPHVGFTDGTHVCLRCVDDDVASHLGSVPAIVHAIGESFPEADRGQITRFLEEPGGLERRLVRSIALLARREGVDYTAMVELVLEAKSALAFTYGAIPRRHFGATTATCRI